MERKKSCKSIFIYSFPDGATKIIFPNGEEKSIYLDGTVHFVDTKGVKTTTHPDGKVELNTKQ